ncbi:acyltransferase [Mesoplasma entomophilum]|uniref:GNAT family N-acetyltransferase n=1 Tax=Mesoplasma entomophilum TaxID=2149 RepID=A0A3S5XZT1_9MOLU|nr:GNAT family N-acetyltransferase [Mesoplasma entomophilum]ATQ35784.1 GNAT family N-acetyltransferase [Mesoplasma entomophilum]ATZ19753.1 acyltransferase [Mesoplasma entomophilum]
MKILFKNFDELTSKEAWEIFKNRSEVFNVEQEWLSCEIDENDLKATHLIIRNDENELIAYLRIFEVDENTVTLGRVLTPQKFRGLGLGKILLENAVKWINEKWPNKKLSISAQYRLLNFYRSFGFVEDSEIYDDEGIDHIKMVLKK